MVSQFSNIKNFCGYKNTKSQNFVANKLPRFSSSDKLILSFKKNNNISSEIDYLNNLNSAELTQMIKKTIKTGSGKSGHYATVFPIRECENLVLRVDNSLIISPDNFGHNYKLVPIMHNNEMIQNNNLGIPLLSLVENDSKFTNNKYLLPKEAFSKSNNVKMWILRKVNGQHPTDKYYQSLTKLLGIKPYDYAQGAYFNDIKKYIFIFKDNKAAINFLDSCKNGKYMNNAEPTYNYKKNKDLEKNAITFYKDYTNFVKDYFTALDNIANLPQETFNKAIADILSIELSNEARLDFKVPNNTLIDFDKKCFNFVDIEFNSENFSKFNYKDPITEFAHVLFGKNVHYSGSYGSNKLPDPYSLIVYDDDKKLLKEKTEKIVEKISMACDFNNYNWTSEEFLRRIEENCDRDFNY